MAAIQPKNTDAIKVNIIQEKTSSSGITLANTTKVDAISESTGGVGTTFNNTVHIAAAIAKSIQQDASGAGNLEWGVAQSTVVTLGAVTTGISAAGTTISDATDLTAFFNNITTVSASQGVQLWDAPRKAMIIVTNTSGTTVAVYPHSGSGVINAGSAGAAVNCATATFNIFFRYDANNWLKFGFTIL